MIRIRVAMAVLTCCLAGCSSDPAKAARRYIQSGDRYTQQGRYKDAAIEYRNAIKLIPQSVEAHRSQRSRAVVRRGETGRRVVRHAAAPIGPAAPRH